jgi:hypothetical protein
LSWSVPHFDDLSRAKNGQMLKSHNSRRGIRQKNGP